MATKTTTAPSVPTAPNTSSVPVRIPKRSSLAPVPAQVPDLLKLVMGSGNISVSIPDAATLPDVEHTLSMVIGGYLRLTDAAERLKPIIGRVLLTISARRLYRPDYKNLTDYIQRKVVDEFKLSRTNAFESLRIARAFPSLTSEDYQRYGASRLLLAASVTDDKAPNFKTLLDESTQKTVDAFSEQIKSMKSPTSTTDTFVLSVRLPAEWKESWESLLTSSAMSAGDLLMELISSYIETHPSDPVPANEPAKAKH